MAVLISTLLRRPGPVRGSIAQVTSRPPRVLLPWQWVRVSGASMVPTLRDGDVVIVRHGASVRSEDLVLARFRSLSHLTIEVHPLPM